MPGHQIGHRRHCGVRLGPVFGGGHQSEVPRRHRKFVVSRHHPEHRYPDRLAGLPQHLFMARRTHPVEDHPADAHPAQKCRKAMQHSGDGLTLPAHIDNQHHRGAQQLGHLPGGAAGR